jgi:hypothetical protein
MDAMEIGVGSPRAVCDVERADSRDGPQYGTHDDGPIIVRIKIDHDVQMVLDG